MGRHVVVGAGPVGLAVARELVARGAGEVVVASRSGCGPEVVGGTRVAVDAADPAALEALTTRGAGADPGVLYNCVNPPSYGVWSTWWPPVADAMIAAAERTGAVLATASCLYGYGPVDGPMTEGLPDAAPGVKGRLRARMWADAKAAHDAGRIRAVEVRGSDYMGPGVTTAHIPVVAPRAVRGRAVRVFGATDQPHSLTDVRDMARTLVAVAAEPSALGRVWHAPSVLTTQGEAVADVCRAVGRAPVPVRVWPGAMLGVGGAVVPLLREMRETVYQFQRPYVLDCSAIERAFGLVPTAWEDTCRVTAEDALSRG